MRRSKGKGAHVIDVGPREKGTRQIPGRYLQECKLVPLCAPRHGDTRTQRREANARMHWFIEAHLKEAQESGTGHFSGLLGKNTRPKDASVQCAG